jgi:O-antigen/teichoic acid export membrane protein
VVVAYKWPTIEGMTIAYAIGAASSFLYSFISVSSRLRPFRRSEATRMFRFAWPLMGSLILNYLVTNMVPLIVARLGPIDLNIFLLANGWRILVLSVPAAITTPLFPYLAGRHKVRDYEAVRQGTWQALRYASMLLLPGVVGLVTYRSVLLNVLANQSYVGPASLPLAILVIGAVPLALSQIIQSSLNAIGRQRLELYITSTQVTVLFAAVFLLMPPWGILPASEGLVAGSVAILASSCAALALNTYFMETLIRVHIHPRSILAIVLSAAGGFEMISQFNRYLPHSRYYELALGLVLGFAAYLAIMLAVGEITREDVRRIGRSIGLPRWLVRPFERLCWRETAPDLAPIDLASAPGLRPSEFAEPFTGNVELPQIEQLPLDDSPDGPDRPS